MSICGVSYHGVPFCYYVDGVGARWILVGGLNREVVVVAIVNL